MEVVSLLFINYYMTALRFNHGSDRIGNCSRGENKFLYFFSTALSPVVMFKSEQLESWYSLDWAARITAIPITNYIISLNVVVKEGVKQIADIVVLFT